MFTTIGVGIATIFRSVKGDSGGGPFEYTAIDNSFSMEFDGASSYIKTDGLTVNNTFTFLLVKCKFFFISKSMFVKFSIITLQVKMVILL